MLYERLRGALSPAPPCIEAEEVTPWVPACPPIQTRAELYVYLERTLRMGPALGVFATMAAMGAFFVTHHDTQASNVNYLVCADQRLIDVFPNESYDDLISRVQEVVETDSGLRAPTEQIMTTLDNLNPTTFVVDQMTNRITIATDVSSIKVPSGCAKPQN